MIDVILGVITGLLIIFLFMLVVYLYLDWIKLRIIRFKPDNDIYWQIAFDEAELNQKLAGRMAEVKMPEKPILKRWLLKIFPGRGKTINIHAPTSSESDYFIDSGDFVILRNGVRGVYEGFPLRIKLTTAGTVKVYSKENFHANDKIYWSEPDRVYTKTKDIFVGTVIDSVENIVTVQLHISSL